MREWTELILPIFHLEALAVGAVSIYYLVAQKRIDSSRRKPKVGGVVWLGLLMTSFMLPLCLPQLIVGRPTPSFLFLPVLFGAGWLRSIWVVFRHARQRASWEGSKLEFRYHGAMTEVEFETLRSVKFGQLDIILNFSDGSTIKFDRNTRALGGLLEGLYVKRPIFEWPRNI